MELSRVLELDGLEQVSSVQQLRRKVSKVRRLPALQAQ